MNEIRLLRDVAPGLVRPVAAPDGEEGEAWAGLGVVRSDRADADGQIAAGSSEAVLGSPMDGRRIALLEAGRDGIEADGEARPAVHVPRVLAAIFAQGGLEADALGPVRESPVGCCDAAGVAGDKLRVVRRLGRETR